MSGSPEAFEDRRPSGNEGDLSRRPRSTIPPQGNAGPVRSISMIPSLRGPEAVRTRTYPRPPPYVLNPPTLRPQGNAGLVPPTGRAFKVRIRSAAEPIRGETGPRDPPHRTTLPPYGTACLGERINRRPPGIEGRPPGINRRVRGIERRPRGHRGRSRSPADPSLRWTTEAFETPVFRGPP